LEEDFAPSACRHLPQMGQEKITKDCTYFVVAFGGGWVGAVFAIDSIES